MSNPYDNPIYDRLIRKPRWPSRRAANWIGIAAGLAGLAASTWALVDAAADPNPEAFNVIIGTFDITLMIVGLCLLLSFTLTALMTARYAVDEEIALLRMTNIPAEKVLAGYAAAALYRLRVVRAVARWFLPAGTIGLAFLIGLTGWRDVLTCAFPVCDNPMVGFVFYGGLAAILFTVLAWILLPRVVQIVVTLGAWIGLRWPRYAAAISGTLFLAGIIAAALASSDMYLLLFLGSKVLTCAIVPLVGYFVLRVLSTQAIKDSVRLIRGRSTR